MHGRSASLTTAWRRDDMVTCVVDCVADVIIMAGKEIVFVMPGREALVVRTMVSNQML